ncbi:hypothetical protein [Oricola thermophila]|uniref:hypothetical protein n=1 Tax=Oricola thermophila TaxID=2742145 RepID=UPI0018D921B0|nr:hypothetical protein [Oricola thermophila]
MDAQRYEKALADPSDVFETPEAVLEADDLDREQKIEILRRWEYNVSEEDVALEEGMPGEESGLLRRILIALGTLVGPIDVSHTPPSKQHGLPRSSLKKGD